MHVPSYWDVMVDTIKKATPGLIPHFNHFVTNP